jgi:hypothetical protein
MKKSVLFFAGILTLSAGLAVGQEKNPSQAASSEKTLTGCVTKGTNPGEFYIADSTSTKTMVDSSSVIASHAGKQVKATGTMSKSGGTEVFKVNKVEVVADTCSAK